MGMGDRSVRFFEGRQSTPKQQQQLSRSSSDNALLVSVVRHADIRGKKPAVLLPLRVLRRSQSFPRFLMSVKKRLGIEYDVEILVTDMSTNRRVVSMVNLKAGQKLMVDEVVKSVANANVTKLGFLYFKRAFGIWEKLYFAVARSTLYGWREQQTLNVDTFGLKVDPNVKTPDLAIPLDGVCLIENGKASISLKTKREFKIWHPVRRQVRLRVPLHDNDAGSWMAAISDASLCSPYPLPPDYYRRTVVSARLQQQGDSFTSTVSSSGGSKYTTDDEEDGMTLLPTPVILSSLPSVPSSPPSPSSLLPSSSSSAKPTTTTGARAPGGHILSSEQQQQPPQSTAKELYAPEEVVVVEEEEQEEVMVVEEKEQEEEEVMVEEEEEAAEELEQWCETADASSAEEEEKRVVMGSCEELSWGKVLCRMRKEELLAAPGDQSDHPERGDEERVAELKGNNNRTRGVENVGEERSIRSTTLTNISYKEIVFKWE